jgi:orotidine-5'-phosphate decarboxylase
MMDLASIVRNIYSKKSFLCVGLDTDIDKIPAHLLDDPNPILAFNKAIIDATKPYCVAYKPNFAFYEVLGSKGWDILKETVDYIGPNHLTIADAKRGDIGNTASRYAKAIFEELNFDAITVAPYMGRDSIDPFLEYQDKWTIVLGLTSNPGHSNFQLQTLSSGIQLYEEVIRQISEYASPNQLMFVVGATRKEYLKNIRNLAPDHFWLVPGVGAQGGSLDEVCLAGMNHEVGL